MTLNIYFNSEEQINYFKEKFDKLNEFIDLPDGSIPIEVARSDNDLYIYIADSFAKYCTDFLFSLLSINLSRGETSKYRMEQLAKKFRRAAEEYLMASIV